jgi:hydrogenase expression/formation protein HypD
MKYVDEFRNGDLAKRLGTTIAREAVAERTYHIMEFCGGHTHAIFRYGVQDLMPSNVHFVHGPGCPVCVLPMGRIDNAIELAERHGAIVCSYGDMMRVPASKRRSLLKAKAEGADVRMVYSVEDALKIARENPGREVVFFAIGFETTTPPSAVAIRAPRGPGISPSSATTCSLPLRSSTSCRAPRCARLVASQSTAFSAPRTSPPSSAAGLMNTSPRSSSDRW